MVHTRKKEFVLLKSKAISAQIFSTHDRGWLVLSGLLGDGDA